MSEVDTDELIVSGYIRMRRANDIPMELISFILSWYKVHGDYWNSKEVKNSISIDANNEIASGRDATCVGSIIISRSTTLQVWKLKLVKFEMIEFNHSCTSGIEIGLVPTIDDHTEFIEELSEYNGYALDLFSGQFYSGAMDFD